MNISTFLRGRVKATFGRVIPTATPRSGGDFLVKQNLPPMIGRRDAAYEQVYILSQQDIFTLSADEQAKLCALMKENIERAILETQAILNILRSPDTVKREHRYLRLLEGINNMINVWLQLVIAKDEWEDNEEEINRFYSHKSLATLHHDIEMLMDCEIAICNRIKHILDDSRYKVLRYRAYMSKSFSKVYLERYTKSYDSYLAIFGKLQD